MTNHEPNHEPNMPDSIHMWHCQCISQWYATLEWKFRYLLLRYYLWVRRFAFSSFGIATRPKTSVNMFTCAFLFFILPGRVHPSHLSWCFGLDLSIDWSMNTPYGKQKELFRSIAKNDLCMPVLRRASKKHEPASGVAAGASAACRFCMPKITIKSDLYPPRNIFWPYTLQPPRRQEFQPASQLSPIVTNTVPWIICESFVTSSQQILLASLLYAQPNTPWKHVDLSLH